MFDVALLLCGVRVVDVMSEANLPYSDDDNVYEVLYICVRIGFHG